MSELVRQRVALLFPRQLREYALVALVAAAQLVGTHFAGQHDAHSNDPDALSYLLLAAGPAALLVRQRFPGTVLLAVFGVTAGYAALDYPAGPVFLSLIVAFFGASVAGLRLLAYLVLVVGYVVFVFVVGYFDDGATLGASLGLAAWLLVLAGVAEAVRLRRAQRAESERSRAERARRAAGEERLRVARELHDTIGHQLSLISVQSGVALHLLEQRSDERPDEQHPAVDGRPADDPAADALRAINEASRQALDELRSVLAVFRDVDDPAPRSPGAGLAELERLVERAREAGLQIRMERHGLVRTVPAGIDAASYRIVQEALTNVARHVGTAAAVTVRLGFGEQELELLVDNDGSTARGVRVSPGGGSGLIGMRERAAAVGGSLAAGPRPGGGFQVVARLPLPSRAEREGVRDDAGAVG